MLVNNSLTCSQFLTQPQLQYPKNFPCSASWLNGAPWPLSGATTTSTTRSTVTNGGTMVKLLDDANAAIAKLNASPPSIAVSAQLAAQKSIAASTGGKLIAAYGFAPTLAQYNNPVDYGAAPQPTAAAVAAAAAAAATSTATTHGYMVIAIGIVVLIILVMSKKGTTFLMAGSAITAALTYYAYKTITTIATPAAPVVQAPVATASGTTPGQ